MRTNLRCGLLLGVVMAALSLPGLQAQGNPAVGLWKNEDAAKTVFIRTYEENGKLVGKVEKLIKGGKEAPDAKCDKCKGEDMNKPIAGLRIIWDMQKDGERWSDGKILDPDDGKVYKCRITPTEGGKKLEVRGSVAIFSKTQVWTRME
jgi:uncharacterized protein (DUF2147 family)